MDHHAHGHAPHGVVNSPARPEAEGLETDKMSKKHIEAHFEAFLGEIYRRIPAEDRKCWKVVVEDSYETGGQNFTDGFLEDFKARYGYDPVPFLPVYAGTVVQSEEISDRFLWDMRRLVADKIAYDYVAGLRDVSHKYGLTTWLENYGHWGFPGEFLQYGGQSDEIGGEFWSEGSLGDIENRAASSCGHIYGKNKISAESFTAGGGGYHRYPAMMKQRGDRFFTEGINNTLLHLYISQPYEEREPGVNATFSNEFNRKNIWFPQLDLFIRYIKRVNFMLQQGLNVADAAYFIGEDAPKMTGITDPALPKGYQFDYINAEVIERDMSVADGMLTLPHDTRYRILVLPKLETMRPELLHKIARLIEQGAVVLGPAPRRSPSYENYPAADREVRSTADALWSQIDPATGYARIGKGMLIDGLTMSQAMKLIGCTPDCGMAEEDPVLYCHRTVNGMEIYFISNQSDKPIRTAPEFRVKGMQPEAWSAIDGSMRTLPAFAPTPDGVRVPLKLDGYESLFIVFRRQAAQPETTDLAAGTEANFPDYKVMQTLGGPWTLTFDPGKRGPARPLVTEELFDFTQHADFDIRHYSGPVTYETTIHPRFAAHGTHIPQSQRRDGDGEGQSQWCLCRRSMDHALPRRDHRCGENRGKQRGNRSGDHMEKPPHRRPETAPKRTPYMGGLPTVESRRRIAKIRAHRSGGARNQSFLTTYNHEKRNTGLGDAFVRKHVTAFPGVGAKKPYARLQAIRKDHPRKDLLDIPRLLPRVGRPLALSVHRTGRRTVRQCTVGLGFMVERHRHPPGRSRSGRQGPPGDRRLRKRMRAQLPPLLGNRRLGARQHLDGRRNPKARKYLQGEHAQALSGSACGFHRQAERRRCRVAARRVLPAGIFRRRLRKPLPPPVRRGSTSGRTM